MLSASYRSLETGYRRLLTYTKIISFQMLLGHRVDRRIIVVTVTYLSAHLKITLPLIDHTQHADVIEASLHII